MKDRVDQFCSVVPDFINSLQCKNDVGQVRDVGVRDSLQQCYEKVMDAENWVEVEGGSIIKEGETAVYSGALLHSMHGVQEEMDVTESEPTSPSSGASGSKTSSSDCARSRFSYYQDVFDNCDIVLQFTMCPASLGHKGNRMEFNAPFFYQTVYGALSKEWFEARTKCIGKGYDFDTPLCSPLHYAEFKRNIKQGTGWSKSVHKSSLGKTVMANLLE